MFCSGAYILTVVFEHGKQTPKRSRKEVLLEAFQKYLVKTVKWFLKSEMSYIHAIDNTGVQATSVPSR